MNAVATQAVSKLRKVIGVKKAAALFSLPRSSFYSAPIPREQQRRRGGGQQPSALNDDERNEIREVFHADNNVDKTPYDVYASLLDEGRYLASIRTFYRVLEANGETTQRRRERTSVVRPVPVLCAREPKEIWSWDISPIATQVKKKFFYLYVVMDIYSRFAPGWCVEEVEDKDRARALFERTCAEQDIEPGTLTVHADNGSQMRSDAIAECFDVLGITKSFSRPRVSNDNAYSEALFKTAKYVPAYPGSFETIEDARAWFSTFFTFYNYEHYHSGIGLLTPASVHFGTASEIIAIRQLTLDIAFTKHPERFRKGKPVAQAPKPAWINKPATIDDNEEKEEEVDTQ